LTVIRLSHLERGQGLVQELVAAPRRQLARTPGTRPAHDLLRRVLVHRAEVQDAAGGVHDLAAELVGVKQRALFRGADVGIQRVEIALLQPRAGGGGGVANDHAATP
jgi:hypothetical protein